MDPPTTEGSDDSQNPATELLESLDDLGNFMFVYEYVVDEGCKIKKPSTTRWAQDVNDLRELNQQIFAMAVNTVNHLIMPGLHPLPSKPAENAGDIKKLAWDIVGEAVPKMTEESWGMTAQSHMKAFTGVLKLLPEEKKGL